MSYPEKSPYPPQQQGPPPPPAYTPGPGQQFGYGQPQGYVQPAAGFGQAYSSNTVVVTQQPNQIVTSCGVRPPDYLVLSIIAIFFCWPMAICAIMASLNSKNAADRGDMATAQAQGSNARNLGIAAIIISIILIVVCVAAPLAVAANTYYVPYCYDC